MGSIHIIDGWPFDHPAYREDYAKWKISDLYRTYFERLGKLAETGLFDSIAHIDLVKKFGYRSEEDVSESFESFLDIAGGEGVLIEINTAGLDKPVREIYPSPDILKAASARNVGVVLGSDSHAPAEVGRYFDRALELLRDAGYGAVNHSERIPFYTA